MKRITKKKKLYCGKLKRALARYVWSEIKLTVDGVLFERTENLNFLEQQMLVDGVERPFIII